MLDNTITLPANATPDNVVYTAISIAADSSNRKDVLGNWSATTSFQNLRTSQSVTKTGRRVLVRIDRTPVATETNPSPKVFSAYLVLDFEDQLTADWDTFLGEMIYQLASFMGGANMTKVINGEH